MIKCQKLPGEHHNILQVHDIVMWDFPGGGVIGQKVEIAWEELWVFFIHWQEFFYKLWVYQSLLRLQNMWL